MWKLKSVGARSIHSDRRKDSSRGAWQYDENVLSQRDEARDHPFEPCQRLIGGLRSQLSPQIIPYSMVFIVIGPDLGGVQRGEVSSPIGRDDDGIDVRILGQLEVRSTSPLHQGR
jgi:hypothetical protein